MDLIKNMVNKINVNFTKHCKLFTLFKLQTPEVLRKIKFPALKHGNCNLIFYIYILTQNPANPDFYKTNQF